MCVGVGVSESVRLCVCVGVWVCLWAHASVCECIIANCIRIVATSLAKLAHLQAENILLYSVLPLPSPPCSLVRSWEQQNKSP